MDNARAHRVSVVVLAYGDEPLLDRCLRCVRADTGPDAEIIVVDNGCTRTDLPAVVDSVSAILTAPAQNLGFAGGCNHGVLQSTGDVIVLVNSDAFVNPGCIEAITDVARGPDVGLASACVVLDQSPDTVNTVGNPVHVSLLSWAGGYGDPRTDHAEPGLVASATGAVVAVERSVWDELGGFWDELFAYLEDCDLSLRCWQSGYEVRYVADAVARHCYEFSRNPSKLYLLERNRLALLLTLYERSTLLRLFPLLVTVEVLMIALATRQGWLRAKLRGWWWLMRNHAEVKRRRSWVQGMRSRSDRDLRWLFTTRVAPANVSPPPGMSMLNALFAGWCRWVLPSEKSQRYPTDCAF